MKVTFRKDYDDELKRLHVKKLFVANLGNRVGMIDDEIIEVMNSEETFAEFIEAAFLWDETPEYFDFWNLVSQGKSVYKYKIL